VFQGADPIVSRSGEIPLTATLRGSAGFGQRAALAGGGVQSKESSWTPSTAPSSVDIKGGWHESLR